MPVAIDLSGTSALVTGSSRGIGRAIARALAGAGASLAVHAGHDLASARKVAAEIEGAGGTARAYRADLSRPRGAADLARSVSHDFGPIDILVQNAGLWTEAPIGSLEDEALERVMQVNLLSVFRLSRALVPKMPRGGRILHISSTASLLGEPDHAHYAASKGGLDALTRSLAVELGPRGITVNSIAPGWTLTEMTRARLRPRVRKRLESEIPLRKLATVEDVARLAVFLASPLAGHITGVPIPVDGGYRIRR